MFHDILTAIKMWLSLCLKSYRIQALSAVNFLIWLLSIYSIDCRILCFYFLLPTGISIVFLDFSFHPIVVQHVLLNCHKLMNFLSFVLSGNINLWCSDRIQDVISFFWCLLRLILDSNMWFILEKSTENPSPPLCCYWQLLASGRKDSLPFVTLSIFSCISPTTCFFRNY